MTWWGKQSKNDLRVLIAWIGSIEYKKITEERIMLG